MKKNSFKKILLKHSFKPVWSTVNEDCDTLMLGSIAPAINLKKLGKKLFFKFSSIFLLGQSLACENSRPSSLPARVALERETPLGPGAN